MNERNISATQLQSLVANHYLSAEWQADNSTWLYHDPTGMANFRVVLNTNGYCVTVY